MTEREAPVDSQKRLDIFKAIPRMRARINALEKEVQETRMLNRRLAELVDVISELLVPLAQGDREAAQRIAEQYRKQI
jgi:hypothetical protein